MSVAALAGRRVDADEAASSSFPAKNISRVSFEIERVLVEEKVNLLISSAAAGADILALRIAQHLNIQCRVILPFDILRFRRTSVIDRDPEWGPQFDEIISALSAAGRVRIISHSGPENAAYSRVTSVILEEAIKAAAPDTPIAIVVWDNQARHSNDFTNEFHLLAQQAGMRERVIPTR